MALAHGGSDDSHGPWWQTLVTHWQFDGIGIAGLGLLLLSIALYLGAVDALRSRGRRWPMGRTGAFVAGAGLVTIAVQSGIDVYDDLGWVHVVQHMFLMTVAAPLLAMGAPVPLALRTCPPRVRAAILHVLRDPAMRIADSRIGALLLIVDYYGSMIVYLCTPLYGWSEEHLAVHLAVHAYFLACGLLFWLPILGRNPTRWRPSRRTATVAVLLGVPVNVAFAGVLLAWDGTLSADSDAGQTADVGTAMAACGLGAAIIGLGLLAIEHRWLRRRITGRPPVPSPTARR